MQIRDRCRVLPTRLSGWALCLSPKSGNESQRSTEHPANPSGLCIDIPSECMFEGEFVVVRDDSATLRAELVGQIPRAPFCHSDSPVQAYFESLDWLTF